MLKQISLSIPQALFEGAREYCSEFGYRNIQEFLTDLLRRKVVLEDHERYKQIEARMKKGKGVKKFDQKGAINYLKGL